MNAILYSLHIAILLARAEKAKAIPVSQIAEEVAISKSYAEMLIMRMRSAGLVRGQRGPNGGYRLARPAAETPLRTIWLVANEKIPRGQALLYLELLLQMDFSLETLATRLAYSEMHRANLFATRLAYSEIRRANLSSS